MTTLSLKKLDNFATVENDEVLLFTFNICMNK